MSESMLTLDIKKFSDVLASAAPVPGGGGASAYVGALGAALGTMVGNFTVGKKKYADVEADIKRLMSEAEEIRGKLLALVEKDAEAFEPLSRAYGIPKDDPKRPEIMEKCLRDAAQVPMEILRLCCKVIILHREFAEKGSTLMISDAGTGAVLCWGAMYGAALNVRVNTKLMTDREYADRLNREVDELMEEHWKIAEDTYKQVFDRLK